MANAGRILILPKGEYNANSTYTMLDLVTYNGASWLAKKTATGITPSDSNSSYWQKLIDVAGKQDTIKGAATTITDENLTKLRALVSDANGKVWVSEVTSTELEYLKGITSNIQTQLNGKSASGHTHDASTLNGTLPLSKGGTGATTTKAAEYNILGGMIENSVSVDDNSRIVCAYTYPNTTDGRLFYRKASVLWDYIKSKMGDIDSASVRYVSDESDANYDWVQVKNASGEWENWKLGNLNGLYVIRNGVLSDEFVFSAYNHKQMYVEQNDGYVTFHKPSSSTTGTLVCSGIDFTPYTKFKFTVTESTDQYNYVAICGNTTTGDLKSQTLTPSAKEYEVDISTISGVNYITISLPINKLGRLSITDMHFE